MLCLRTIHYTDGKVPFDNNATLNLPIFTAYYYFFLLQTNIGFDVTTY